MTYYIGTAESGHPGIQGIAITNVEAIGATTDTSGAGVAVSTSSSGTGVSITATGSGSAIWASGSGANHTANISCSQLNAYAAVLGTHTNGGTGLYAQSNTTSTSGNAALVAVNSSSGDGVYATSSTGTAFTRRDTPLSGVLARPRQLRPASVGGRAVRRAMGSTVKLPLPG